MDETFLLSMNHVCKSIRASPGLEMLTVDSMNCMHRKSTQFAELVFKQYLNVKDTFYREKK